MLTSGVGAGIGSGTVAPPKNKKMFKKVIKNKGEIPKKGLLFFSKEKVITEYCKYI